MKIATEFEVEREVVAVNEKGDITRGRVKLIKFRGKIKGKPATQLKAGDVIESLSENGRRILTVNGKPATPLQVQLAPNVMLLGKGGHIGDDDEYGHSGKVRVGDEWAINPISLWMAESSPALPDFKLQQVEGTMKLVAVTERDGQPCLSLRAALKIKGGEGMEMPGLPGIKFTEMSATSELVSQLPVAADAMIAESELRWTTRLAAQGETMKNGRRFKLDSSTESQQVFKWRARSLP